MGVYGDSGVYGCPGEARRARRICELSVARDLPGFAGKTYSNTAMGTVVVVGLDDSNRRTCPEKLKHWATSARYLSASKCERAVSEGFPRPHG